MDHHKGPENGGCDLVEFVVFTALVIAVTVIAMTSGVVPIRRQNNAPSDDALERAAEEAEKKLASARPTNSSYHQIAAMAYTALQKPEQALHVCDLGLAVEPESATLFSNRAAVHIQLANRSAAVDDATRAVSCDGDRHTPAVYYTYGRALLFNHKYAEALKVAETLESKGHKDEALCIRGEALLRTNDFEGAFDSFSKALNTAKQAPHRMECFRGRAIVRSTLGDDSNALLDVTNGIRLTSHRGALLICRARLNMIAGQSALPDLYEAVNARLTNATRAQFLSERARQYLLDDDLSNAAKLAEDALTADAGSPAILVTSALVLERQGNYQAALTQLDQAISIDPYFAEGYWIRHRVHASMDNSQQSAADKATAEKYRYRPYL